MGVLYRAFSPPVRVMCSIRSQPAIMLHSANYLYPVLYVPAVGMKHIYDHTYVSSRRHKFDIFSSLVAADVTGLLIPLLPPPYPTTTRDPLVGWSSPFIYLFLFWVTEKRTATTVLIFCSIFFLFSLGWGGAVVSPAQLFTCCSREWESAKTPYFFSCWYRAVEILQYHDMSYHIMSHRITSCHSKSHTYLLYHVVSYCTRRSLR